MSLAIWQDLIDREEAIVYAIVNQASAPALNAVLAEQIPHRPLVDQSDRLYRGTHFDSVIKYSPLLLRLTHETPIWPLLDDTLGQSQIALCAGADADKIVAHLRKRLLIDCDEGAPVHLRYFSPQHLQSLLTQFEPERIQAFSGPIQHWGYYNPQRQSWENYALNSRAYIDQPFTLTKHEKQQFISPA